MDLEALIAGGRLVPQFESQLESQQRWASMQDLLDARRLREQELRLREQQIGWTMEDRAREQKFRDLLAAGRPFTVEQAMGASPQHAMQYYSGLAEMQKKRAEAAGTLLENRKKADEVSNTAKMRMLNQLYGMLEIENEDERRKQYEVWRDENINAGFVPEQWMWKEMPSEADARSLFTTVAGPVLLQDLDAKRAEAAQKAALHEQAIRKATAEASQAEAVLLGEAKPQPGAVPQAPALFTNWYNSSLAASGVQDSPAERKAHIEKWVAMNAINQGMTPEALEQRLNLARQQAAIDAANAANKPQSAEAAKVTAIAETLIPELLQLKQRIADGGKAAIMAILSGSDPDLRKLATNAADKVGRFRSGGAVNPAEEARFMGAIASMADLPPWVKGTLPSQNAIDRYVSEAQIVLRGVSPGGRTAPAAQPQVMPAKPKADEEWEKGPDGIPRRKR